MSLFLNKSSTRINAYERSKRQKGDFYAIILFSKDELIKHSVMTICKDEGVFVFATDTEEELDRFVSQRLSIKILPVLVFDRPKISEEALSFNDGVRAVFPMPFKEGRKDTFINDIIISLDALKYYIKGIFDEKKDVSTLDNRLDKLKDRLLFIRNFNDPTDISSAVLWAVSEMFERSITFVVRPDELIGEWSIGVSADKNTGLTSAMKLKIPLTKPSVFSNVLETGQFFYGEINDATLNEHLFKLIGKSLNPIIILLSMKCREKIVAMAYRDFGIKEPSHPQIDLLEILADQAGLVLENLLSRRYLNKVPQS